MKSGDTIELRSNDSEEDAFLSRMEKTITPVVKKLNDERCRINGTSGGLIDYPLPTPFEGIRAFVLRFKCGFMKRGR